MRRINTKQRQIFAEKMLDLANIAAGALVFGQLVSPEIIRWYLIVVGVGIIFVGYFIAILLTNKL